MTTGSDELIVIMDEKELEVMLEKEEVVFEDRDEDINGNEQGILCGELTIKLTKMMP